MDFHEFLHCLACPQSGEKFEFDSTQQTLQTQSGIVYPVRNNIPILLTEEDQLLFAEVLNETGKSMVDEYQQFVPQPLEPPAAENAKPAETFPPLNLPQNLIDEFYWVNGEDTQILSVGGGPTRNNEKEINLNMGLFPNVDLVGNACRLPFQTGSVDGVWCNAVLEHIEGAPKAAQEIERVTKSGGGIMLLVPFMQPLHGYPSDFQRYTAAGLASLLSDSDILETGQAVGPSYTLYEILTQYLNGPGMKTLPRWMRGFCRRILIPHLRKSSQNRTDIFEGEAEALSSLVYCIARKR